MYILFLKCGTQVHTYSTYNTYMYVLYLQVQRERTGDDGYGDPDENAVDVAVAWRHFPQTNDCRIHCAKQKVADDPVKRAGVKSTVHHV